LSFCLRKTRKTEHRNDAALRAIAAAWDSLSEFTKGEIVAMVRRETDGD